MKVSIRKLYIMVFVFAIISCEEEIEKSETFIPFDDRKVFMALTPGSGDVDLTSALDKAYSMGFDGPGDLNLDWGVLEPNIGQYTDPDGIITWCKERLQGKPLHLTLAPIQTTYTSLPIDLHGLSWNDSLLINAYKNTLNYLHVELEGIDIQSIAIGNEVDIVLGSDMVAWNNYTQFFEAVANEGRALWPKADIGVKLTFDVIQGGSTGLAADIIAGSDALLVSYYPEVDNYTGIGGLVQDNMDAIIEEFPNKDIHLVEVGFPSNSQLGSSEKTQADFVCDIFQSWDDYNSRIKTVTFVWLYDLSEETLDALVELYGINDPAFVNFLGSLGYLTHNKIEKKAYDALVEGILKRR